MTIHDRTGGLRHWTPRIAPAITTTTLLAAARVWNENGAEHDAGAAFLMGAFAFGSGMLGVSSAGGTNGESAITAVAFGGAATFAMVGVAAYTDPLPLPIIMWLIATIATYAVCVKYWREDMREEYRHLRALERARLEHQHGEKVETIRAGAATDVAASAFEAARLRQAYEHRRILDDHPELAGFGIAAEILLGDGVKEPTER